MTTAETQTMVAAIQLLGAQVIQGDLADYAIEAAAHGWQIFPLRGKVPAIGNPHLWGTPERATCHGECGRPGHGVWDATSDLEVVESWWRGRYAGANIGGRVPENAMLIDVDPRNGGHLSWQTLVDTFGRPPTTLSALSGRRDGGRHFYYRAPADVKLTGRNLGAGLDLKTRSGYGVLPPSIHPSTGWPYAWDDDVPIAEPPGWLLDLVIPTPPPPPRPVMPRGTIRGPSIADQFSSSTSWAQILVPHGWRCLDPDGDVDGARWVHPAATSPWSATVKHQCLFIYSTSTDFDETVPGDPRGYTRFRAYAVLDHAGDLSKAARHLLKGQ